MIDGTTKIFGIFGDPVEHSRSPAMHNACFAALGMDAVYVPYRVSPAQLPQAVAAVKALQLGGVNVTVPHKEQVVPLLDDLDPLARQIGAVNTLVPQNGRLVGYNTDGLGFIQALKRDLNLSVDGRTVLVLGAGGASRAGVFSLAREGAARIFLANRTMEKAEDLAASVCASYPATTIKPLPLTREALSAAVADVDLIVNTISAGLSGEGLACFPWARVISRTCFFDMLYSSNNTVMIGHALEQGLTCADGKGMLAGQGEEAFRLWTGQSPPTGLMRRVLQSSA